MTVLQKMSVAICALAAVISGGCGDDENAAAGKTAKMYIALIPKGTQHPFWQAVHRGAQAAADKFKVEITYDGLPLDARWNVQADMVQAAANKNAAAICVAPFGPKYLNETLRKIKAVGIPVLVFDSPLPDAPAGTVACTLATDNAKAGALAAEQLFAAAISARVSAATAEKPVTIGVVQDTDSNITNLRADGFVEKAGALAAQIFPDGVQTSRNGEIVKPAAGAAKVLISVMVAPTSSYEDLQNAAQQLLEQSADLTAIFCTTEGAALGVLSATRDGVELDRDHGAYKNIEVIGFESGITQKNAIRKNYFYGAVTQDAFRIGYLTVETAIKAARREAVAPQIDTGVRFYTAESIDTPEIAGLLYD